AERLGLSVTVLTDHPDEHDGLGVRVVPCDVQDFRAVLSAIAALPEPDAVFSNSDHLQVQAALTAEYLGLPGKPWPAALRAQDKAELRRHLAAAGVDLVRSVTLHPTDDPTTLGSIDLPFPCVLKPREGVASEDVVLVTGSDELVRRATEVRARRPGAALVVEEYLDGDLRTLETLGDGDRRHVLGGFRTELSAPPYFVETRMEFVPEPPEKEVEQVLAQLDALGVGFGICHTEYVVDASGQARLIEVNDRAIGDHCDLLLAELTGLPLFELVLRLHLGEPLPVDLPVRRDGAARVEYPCATTPGTLVSAPEATTDLFDGIHLSYRPSRAIGETHPVHHTNRDYLGTLMTWGHDQESVDRVAADYLADNRWEIVP
ncbi:acetyl-CoA carboxylase biotin carboxylase subunit family protein, partial [Nocardioides sp.]|uniref:ATP-grasp domain-containing protein n=1 Tax=Nocardioides sp. TaxID=35761 RepID=UPI003565DB2B